MAPASDASFPERNLIFALIAPNGDTLRFMFVAQNDWNMAQNESDAAPWNSCAPQVADLAASLGSAPRCFLFSLGCLVARVATIQLTPDWRVFIEYRRDLTHAGRPCRDWSHPEELDHSGRETIRNLIRRADGSYQILQ